MNYRRISHKAEKAKETFAYYRPSAVGERVATNALSRIEIKQNRKLWQRLIALGIIGSASIWLFMLLFHAAFLLCVNFLFNLGKIAGIFYSLPFWFAFLAVYSLFRLRKPDFEESPQFESGLMSTYSYRTEANKVWLVWLFAGVAGASNLMLMIFAYWLL